MPSEADSYLDMRAILIGNCGEIGSLAAVYCLEQRGPQSHNYTKQEFIARFRKCFDDGGKLNELLE